MFDFEQIATVNGRRFPAYGQTANTRRSPSSRGDVMSEADQFREYAQEALQWAGQSTIENEKRALLELARTWWEAALERDSLPNAFG